MTEAVETMNVSLEKEQEIEWDNFDLDKDDNISESHEDDNEASVKDNLVLQEVSESHLEEAGPGWRDVISRRSPSHEPAPISTFVVRYLSGEHNETKTKHSFSSTTPFAQLCFDEKRGSLVTAVGCSETSHKHLKVGAKTLCRNINTEKTTPTSNPSLVALSSSSSSDSIGSLSTLTDTDVFWPDKKKVGLPTETSDRLPENLPFVMGIGPCGQSDGESDNYLHLLHDVGYAEPPTWSSRQYGCTKAIKKMMGAHFRSSSAVKKTASRRRASNSNKPFNTSRILPKISSKRTCAYEPMEY